MTESTATQHTDDAQDQQQEQQQGQQHEQQQGQQHEQQQGQQQEQRTLYDIIGGETRLRELVDRFYDLMQLEKDFAGIHAMHPVPNDGSRDKLFMFLSGWMGGPNLFIERFGHPMLRARHLPYAIGTSERDQWLRCMAQALEDMGYDYDLRLRLMTSFYQTADWMRNRPH